MAQMKTCHFKLVLIGDTAVGKSCLVVRFVRDEFFEFQEPTIGAAFLTQTVSMDDGVTVKFEIWDTAGQERYRSLAPMYYRGAAAAIVVYDVTNKDSFTGAMSWVKELQRRGDPNVIIALAGNKADLESRRTVDFEVFPRDMRVMSAYISIGSASIRQRQRYLAHGDVCEDCCERQRPVRRNR
ncbi:hypothetical protein, variant [Aphanomyces invadans]|uniref:Uncharacterized protein n=1 Tax=Aphanomyces invadans TaxID=157072 RepID=A0A024U918_9STRA|nr:hypothetical protein, variant [Aphanomyces invadans]ETW02720.1 hypothetical protein, variant [Aphanomyces invadans]|eukprot:XP_008869325.1 hypothetical protein, variant [Aphanomyces invadans]